MPLRRTKLPSCERKWKEFRTNMKPNTKYDTMDKNLFLFKNAERMWTDRLFFYQKLWSEWSVSKHETNSKTHSQFQYVIFCNVFFLKPLSFKVFDAYIYMPPEVIFNNSFNIIFILSAISNNIKTDSSIKDNRLDIIIKVKKKNANWRLYQIAMCHVQSSKTIRSI